MTHETLVTSLLPIYGTLLQEERTFEAECEKELAKERDQDGFVADEAGLKALYRISMKHARGFAARMRRLIEEQSVDRQEYRATLNGPLGRKLLEAFYGLLVRYRPEGERAESLSRLNRHPGRLLCDAYVLGWSSQKDFAAASGDVLQESDITHLFQHVAGFEGSATKLAMERQLRANQQLNVVVPSATRPLPSGYGPSTRWPTVRENSLYVLGLTLGRVFARLETSECREQLETCRKLVAINAAFHYRVESAAEIEALTEALLYTPAAGFFAAAHAAREEVADLLPSYPGKPVRLAVETREAAKQLEDLCGVGLSLTPKQSGFKAESELAPALVENLTGEFQSTWEVFQKWQESGECERGAERLSETLREAEAKRRLDVEEHERDCGMCRKLHTHVKTRSKAKTRSFSEIPEADVIDSVAFRPFDKSAGVIEGHVGDRSQLRPRVRVTVNSRGVHFDVWRKSLSSRPHLALLSVWSTPSRSSRKELAVRRIFFLKAADNAVGMVSELCGGAFISVGELLQQRDLCAGEYWEHSGRPAKEWYLNPPPKGFHGFTMHICPLEHVPRMDQDDQKLLERLAIDEEETTLALAARKTEQALSKSAKVHIRRIFKQSRRRVENALRRFLERRRTETLHQLDGAINSQLDSAFPAMIARVGPKTWRSPREAWGFIYDLVRRLFRARFSRNTLSDGWVLYQERPRAKFKGDHYDPSAFRSLVGRSHAMKLAGVCADSALDPSYRVYEEEMRGKSRAALYAPIVLASDRSARADGRGVVIFETDAGEPGVFGPGQVIQLAELTRRIGVDVGPLEWLENSDIGDSARKFCPWHPMEQSEDRNRHDWHLLGLLDQICEELARSYDARSGRCSLWYIDQEYRDDQGPKRVAFPLASYGASPDARGQRAAPVPEILRSVIDSPEKSRTVSDLVWRTMHPERAATGEEAPVLIPIRSGRGATKVSFVLWLARSWRPGAAPATVSDHEANEVGRILTLLLSDFQEMRVRIANAWLTTRLSEVGPSFGETCAKLDERLRFMFQAQTAAIWIRMRGGVKYIRVGSADHTGDTIDLATLGASLAPFRSSDPDANLRTSGAHVSRRWHAGKQRLPKFIEGLFDGASNHEAESALVCAARYQEASAQPDVIFCLGRGKNERPFTEFSEELAHAVADAFKPFHLDWIASHPAGQEGDFDPLSRHPSRWIRDVDASSNITREVGWILERMEFELLRVRGVAALHIGHDPRRGENRVWFQFAGHSASPAVSSESGDAILNDLAERYRSGLLSTRSVDPIATTLEGDRTIHRWFAPIVSWSGDRLLQGVLSVQYEGDENPRKVLDLLNRYALRLEAVLSKDTFPLAKLRGGLPAGTARERFERDLDRWFQALLAQAKDDEDEKFTRFLNRIEGVVAASAATSTENPTDPDPMGDLAAYGVKLLPKRRGFVLPLHRCGQEPEPITLTFRKPLPDRHADAVAEWENWILFRRLVGAAIGYWTWLRLQDCSIPEPESRSFLGKLAAGLGRT